jgi:hypothetical protein
MQLDALDGCFIPFLATPVPATVIWKASGESTPDEALAHLASLIADDEEADHRVTDDVPDQPARCFLAELTLPLTFASHSGVHILV